MKKIIFILAICFCCLCAFSQEHMTFKNIPIDGTIEEFSNKLESEGFVVTYSADNGKLLKGKFAGEEVEVIIPCEKGNKVWKVVASFKEYNSWTSLRLDYNKYKIVLTSKYGEGTSYEFFTSPYKEGDGYELTAVSVGKCDYATYYDTDLGSVALEISKDKRIEISYEDKANTEMKNRQKTIQELKDL